MKYVIVNHNGCDVPVIFADVVEHIMFKYMEPISAGKCSIGIDIDDKRIYHAWGESKSLNLKSRPEDADIIKHAFSFEG